MTTFSFTIPLYVISKASVRKRTRYILEQFAFVCVQAFTTRCQVCRGTAPPCPYKSRSYPYEIRYKCQGLSRAPASSNPQPATSRSEHWRVVRALQGCRLGDAKRGALGREPRFVFFLPIRPRALH